MDLATVIIARPMRRDERLPSVTALMEAYGVANATAVAALRRLRELGLTRTVAGSGTYVGDVPFALRPEPEGEYAARYPTGDVVLLFQAGRRCISEAAVQRLSDRPDTAPTIGVYAYDHEEGRDVLVRHLDAGALAAWDRRALRALGDSFVAAARLIVGYGVGDVERHLITIARLIMDSAAVRPEGQAPIALAPGYEESVIGAAQRRIWPKLFTEGGPDDPPF